MGFLPCDIVSVYFGACGTAYSMFLLAGIAGSLLSIVTTTLLGEKISDPFSIEFLIVLLCRIAVSISAVVINYQLNKKKKWKDNFTAHILALFIAESFQIG